ncbi:MAG: CHAT domain-containing protein [Gemmatimonadaceae bacterium]|nr:CHAT domain-containing protein [Gemmatimonadaceae bacterium]
MIPPLDQTPGDRPFEPLDLSVLSAGDGHVWLSAHSQQGEVHGVPRLLPDFTAAIGDGDVSDWFGRSIAQAVRQQDEALRIGRVLRDLIFGIGEIESLFDQTRGVAARRGGPLLVRLLVAPGDVAAWPWELLVDPQHPDRFLALTRDVHLVRTARARTYPARSAPITPPLHLLLVLSSPLRGSPGESEAVFDLYEEKRALLAELRPLVDKGLLHVDVEERPSVDRLRSRMARKRHGYHMVHYLGHAQPAGLKLEDPLGRGRLVRSDEFSALLQELPDLRLAVFAGCETARAPRTTVADRWPGQLSTTDYCVRDASPAVIGMQAVLPFSTERIFTRFFYQSLTAGRSVAESLRLARLAITDDDRVGTGLLDWAVPCLFTGGSAPGPLIDPTARAVPLPASRRASLRLDARQSDLRFFARQTELREAIDVLSGQNHCRLLQVVGTPGVGKSRLLDRAFEELDDGVARLFVTARRLVASDDPVHELCCLVEEVSRQAGRRTTARGKRSARDWWERLLEDVSEAKIAIGIDDADVLHDATTQPLVEALAMLTGRRGAVRLALTATREHPGIVRDLPSSSVRVIRLQPLAWPEVWQWVRRNLPVLTRYGDTALSPYFADLGAHLELWSELAEAITARSALTTAELPEVVRAVAQRVSTLPSANITPPPVFSATLTPPSGVPAAPRIAPAPAAGAGAGAPRSSPPEPSRPARLQSLRVAIAGPHTDGRAAEFSRAVTALAAQLGVGGRVVLSDGPDGSLSLAQLLDAPSPFGADGIASEALLLEWVERVQGQGANIVLLDFGVAAASGRWEEVVRAAHARGVLLVAAGSNGETPVYPAWFDGVLAVGALGANGRRAPYALYDTLRDKPELFAPETTDGSLLELVVPVRGARGSSFAALHVVAAAVMVWATDRTLSAADVREVLMRTARRIDGGGLALDEQSALTDVRRQLLLDALEWGPLETGELLAETGLRSELALPLIDALLAKGTLRRVMDRNVEHYEHPEAVYLTYEKLRREAPSTDERTAALQKLLSRIRRLAQRGRFEPDEVRSMWASDHPGRRIAALGAMTERPELRDFDIVLNGIASSRSAFEQFEALSLATKMVTALSPEQCTRLREALRVQRSPAGWIRDEHDRAVVADGLLSWLESGEADMDDGDLITITATMRAQLGSTVAAAESSNGAAPAPAGS